MSGFEELHDHLADVHISPWSDQCDLRLQFFHFFLVIRFIICAMDWDVNSATLVQIQHYFSRECSSVITGTWWTVRNQKAITMLIYWSVSVEFWLYFSLLLLMMKQPLSMGNGENAIWFLSKLMMMCVCVYSIYCFGSTHAGQRDKPFVSESEHELRTPRPDLLDRPYAPDYAGESFRNQYKVWRSGETNSETTLDTFSFHAHANDYDVFLSVVCLLISLVLWADSKFHHRSNSKAIRCTEEASSG